MRIRFQSSISKLPHLNMFFLNVPPAIVKKAGGILKNRLLCTVNKKVTFPCALLSRKNGAAYISINKKRMKDADVKAGDEVVLILEKDNSTYGMPMPEELQEVLDQDTEARDRFNALTPGKQRNIIHFVSSVKSSQLKIDRSLKLLNNLKNLPRGKEKVREIFLGPGM